MTVFAYTLRFDDGVEHRFDIDVDRAAEPSTKRGALPVWTALQEHRCPCCPLRHDDEAACPAARALVPFVERFAALRSTVMVDVVVTSDAREVRKRTDLQTALGALFGLVMATSGCPILGRMQPLARMHLPFPTPAEGLFRSVALLLLRAFLAGRTPTLDELRAHHQDIDEVNQAFAERLRAAAQKDASINALVTLQSAGALIGFSLDDDLEALRALVGG